MIKGREIEKTQFDGIVRCFVAGRLVSSRESLTYRDAQQIASSLRRQAFADHGTWAKVQINLGWE